MDRELLGVCLLIIQAGLLLPLIIELRRTKTSAVISALGESLWVAAGLGWLLYGFLTHSDVLITSGSLAVLGGTIVLLVIRRDVSHAIMSASLWCAIGCLFIFLFSAIFGGLSGLVVSLSVFSIIQLSLCTIASARRIKHKDGYFQEVKNPFAVTITTKG